METIETAYGRRLLPAMVDERARTTPNQLYAHVPKSDNLKGGFEVLSYGRLANAINKLSWWMIENLGAVKAGDFDTVAYIGPNDVRYVIALIAAMKTRRPILIPLPYNNEAATTRLLDLTSCNYLLAPKSHMHKWDEPRKERPHVKAAQVPKLAWLLDDSIPIEHFPYTKTYEEARNDPAYIIQSSGTTGTPKPLRYTHAKPADVDRDCAASKASPPDQKLARQHLYCGATVIAQLPLSWAAGLGICVWWAMYNDLVPIFLPIDAPQPMTAAYIDQARQAIPSTLCIAVPDTLRQLVKEPSYLENMKQFKAIAYAGAPLDDPTGDILSKITRVQSSMAATDVGLYPILLSEPHLWKYHRFHPTLGGFAFEHYFDDLYELVVHKDLHNPQPCFQIYPDVDVVHTKDLWRKHPTLEGFWSTAGRADSFVKLCTLKKFNAVDIESIVNRHPAVKASVVGGDGRTKPFVIVEPTEEVRTTCHCDEEILEKVWPALEDANKVITDEAKLVRELIIIADADMPTTKTAKGTVQRRMVTELYAEKIDALYEKVATQ